jgi:hypothetical protein
MRDLWPSVLARNPLPQVFSPPPKRLLVVAFRSKYLGVQVLHCVSAFQVQAAGGGHLRSRIAGEWSPDEDQMETKMTAIGYVNKQDDGRYSGSIKSISIRAGVEIIPNLNKTSDAQPDYRVLTQGIEIGAGWTKEYGSATDATKQACHTAQRTVCGRPVQRDWRTQDARRSRSRPSPATRHSAKSHATPRPLIKSAMPSRHSPTCCAQKVNIPVQPMTQGWTRI